MPIERVRCGWARNPPFPEYEAYHDEEWGVPVHDDRLLFEFLTLEGAQAGLSWATILRKRPYYRQAFAGFDPAAVARFTVKRQEKLLANPGIVRNRLKVASTIDNARAVLAVQAIHAEPANVLSATGAARPAVLGKICLLPEARGMVASRRHAPRLVRCSADRGLGGRLPDLRSAASAGG